MRANSSNQPTVVVLGDINVDVLALLDRPPTLGGDCLSQKLELHCGGVGANTALALAKWGTSVRLVGSTGRDWFGNYVLDVLRSWGVDVSFVQRVERALTGLILVAVSPDGQRTMFGSRAANAEWENSLETALCLRSAHALHLVGYSFLTPAVAEVAQGLLREAHRLKIPVSLDVGMAASRRIPSTILHAASRLGILFATLDEATALTGQADSRDAFEALEKSGVPEVVVKLGDAGCLVRDEGQLRQAPAFAVRATDTTGAGDAFTAAFLRARLRDWPKAEAALLANAAGAAAAAVVGAGEQLPGPENILPLLNASRLSSEWERVRKSVLARSRVESRRAGPAGF